MLSGKPDQISGLSALVCALCGSFLIISTIQHRIHRNRTQNQTQNNDSPDILFLFHRYSVLCRLVEFFDAGLEAVAEKFDFLGRVIGGTECVLNLLVG